MTTDEQTELWVKGNPVHNHSIKIGGRPLKGGECCPDFSCCKPHLLAPLKEREKFRDHPEFRAAMLVVFLARMLKDSGHEVKIL